MTRLFRRRSDTAGRLLPLFDGLQQSGRKRNRKIGKELVSLRRKARAHHKSDQRTLQRPYKKNDVRVQIFGPAQDFQILESR